MHDTDGDGQHDVILEKDAQGNTFLHLVMPASAVNFLNGSDASSMFDFGQDPNGLGGASASGSYTNEDDFDNVFVELGCKVYEVNKVYYRGTGTGNEPSGVNAAAV